MNYENTFFWQYSIFLYLVKLFLTVDFFPDGEKFCKILYLIVVKKKHGAQSIYFVCKTFSLKQTKVQ